MSASPLQPVVIWFGRVGDMIMLTALLDILHSRFGRACRVIGAGAWSQDIYAEHPDVAETLWLHRYTPFAFDVRWWRTVWKLRRAPCDPVYVCETDPRKLASIRRLLHWGGVDRARCVFLTETPAALAQVHWVDRLVTLGRQLPGALQESDYPWPVPAPRCAPRLVLSSAARAAGEEWLHRHGVGEAPLVLLQPGNRRTMRGRSLRIRESDDRFWPVERWASLIHRIHAQLPEARIVLCGAPREAVLLGWIEAAAALPEVVLRGLPFPGLFALCTRAHSMISIDTGTAHAAAALGTPLVVLFGSTPPAQVTPRSPCGSPVIGVGGVPLLPRVDQLPVEAVFEAWSRLLVSSTSAATGP
ncbi:MAG: glycosyltransferase family 9 protein [Gammaproteobacteria bacterium]|nr:glycosyltransferase family 9 protein [Gammaproteobacteria bacterium]MBV9726208.1 glycosyltransferase family 9 protein [Gammaproteobacteria bacterium]